MENNGNSRVNRASRRLWSGGCIALAALLLAACTYQGYDNPVPRKFSWFSYVNGDDVRSGCAVGAPDQLRFVYNAIYFEQVRSYDLVPAAEPGRTEMTTRVTQTADLSGYAVEGSILDLFKPWRPVKSITVLRDTDFAELKRAMASDGVLGRAPVGLELPSYEFYWLIAACIDGAFYYHAFLWPKNDVTQLGFAKLLFSWDFTDIPVNPPRKASLFDLFGTPYPKEHRNVFNLRVAENGLWGIGYDN